VRSRFIKYPFDKLIRNFEIDFSEPPPCDDLAQIGQDIETLISSIGPDLSRFLTDRDRVADVIEFLGKIMGRSPQREERLAAATLDMALQVYHTYTRVDLRHVVQWHADVWVPQQMRVIEDEKVSDDVLGCFIRDVWDLNRKDPIANPNGVVWAHLYRTKFFASCDDPSNPSRIVRGVRGRRKTGGSLGARQWNRNRLSAAGRARG
jgi:hypothetical protein